MSILSKIKTAVDANGFTGLAAHVLKAKAESMIDAEIPDFVSRVVKAAAVKGITIDPDVLTEIVTDVVKSVEANI